MQHAVQVSGCCGSLGGKPPAISFDWNLAFLQSFPGRIKIAHTVLGMICLVVIGHYSQFFHPLTGSSLGLLCSKSSAFFLLVSYGFFVTSLILLFSCTFSYFTASFLPKTAFEFIFHLFACILYLTSSLVLMVSVITSNSDFREFKEPGYEAKIGVSALGLLNSVLYGVSTFFSFQSQKQMA